MGLLQPKGPNLDITNPADPRYSAAREVVSRPTEMGISGDADVLIGKGFEREFIAANMETNVAAGDYAYIGNRVGMVTAVTKNAGKVELITVVEDLRCLPIEWQATPAAYGYDNEPNSTTRTTVYAIGGNVAEDVINANGAVLAPGTILICKKRTADSTTWTDVAQSAAEFQSSLIPVDSVNLGYASLNVSKSATTAFVGNVFPYPGVLQRVTWSMVAPVAGVTLTQTSECNAQVVIDATPTPGTTFQLKIVSVQDPSKTETVTFTIV